MIAITHPLNTAGHFVAAGAAGVDPWFVVEGSWFERRVSAGTCARDGYTMTRKNNSQTTHARYRGS